MQTEIEIEMDRQTTTLYRSQQQLTTYSGLHHRQTSKRSTTISGNDGLKVRVILDSFVILWWFVHRVTCKRLTATSGNIMLNFWVTSAYVKIIEDNRYIYFTLDAPRSSSLFATLILEPSPGSLLFCCLI